MLFNAVGSLKRLSVVADTTPEAPLKSRSCLRKLATASGSLPLRVACARSKHRSYFRSSSRGASLLKTLRD